MFLISTMEKELRLIVAETRNKGSFWLHRVDFEIYLLPYRHQHSIGIRVSIDIIDIIQHRQIVA
jgi:hypothetical protein